MEGANVQYIDGNIWDMILLYTLLLHPKLATLLGDCLLQSHLLMQVTPIAP